MRGLELDERSSSSASLALSLTRPIVHAHVPVPSPYISTHLADVATASVSLAPGLGDGSESTQTQLGRSALSSPMRTSRRFSAHVYIYTHVRVSGPGNPNVERASGRPAWSDRCGGGRAHVRVRNSSAFNVQHSTSTFGAQRCQRPCATTGVSFQLGITGHGAWRVVESWTVVPAVYGLAWERYDNPCQPANGHEMRCCLWASSSLSACGAPSADDTIVRTQLEHISMCTPV